MKATSTAMAPIAEQSGVLALTGYGLSITMRRGRLVIDDGVADERRRLVFARVGSGLKRVIVIGHSGTVSLDALRWLADVGVAFVHIDADARLIAVGGTSELHDARVFRGQAAAQATGADITLAQYLLAAKVRGQAAVSERLPHAARLRTELERMATQIETTASLRELCYLESIAAAAYWDAWSSTVTPFIRSDEATVPAHWRTVGVRHSPLSNKPARAVSPAHAILNYLYAILEAETRLALIAVGCAPSLGVVHVDRMSRDSLVFDVMEPVRPHVDALVLDLFSSRQFACRDFFETRDGQCKLMPQLTHPLAQTAERWAQLVAPYAERVATVFAQTGHAAHGGAIRSATTRAPVLPSEAVRAPAPRATRTPLTRLNQRPAGATSRRWTRAATADPTSLLPARCQSCGTKLAGRTRMYCDTCLAALDQRPCVAGVIRSSARRKAQEIPDRRSSPAVTAARWGKIAARQAEHAEWVAEHGAGPSRTVFLREITPTLQAVPVEVLVAATGLSRAMCYRVRRGHGVPHWRHWEPIRDAVTRFQASPQADPEWKRLPDDTYARRIAPFIAALPTKALRAAAGFSEAYVSLIKRGHYVPHRRHWPALLAVIDEQMDGEMARG